MKNYNLKHDESVYFKNSAILLPNRQNKPKKEKECFLSLTNQNILVEVNVKKLFRTAKKTKAYPLKDVKNINDNVQVIINASTVDIYLTETDISFKFENEEIAANFYDEALLQITGDSKLVRAIKKTQKVIKETTNAIDLDFMKIAGGMIKKKVEKSKLNSTKKSSGNEEN